MNFNGCISHGKKVTASKMSSAKGTINFTADFAFWQKLFSVYPSKPDEYVPIIEDFNTCCVGKTR